MSKINVQLARLGAFAPVVLRVVGTIMAYHGLKKFQGGLDGVEGFFRMVDAPAPAITAPLGRMLGTTGAGPAERIHLR